MAGDVLVVRWLPMTAQKVVPWRNGAGSTREVAIEPPTASVATGFAWRVSIAGVAADGPFSTFPGVDRSLWLLRGAGMELEVDGARMRLDGPLQRIQFAGEQHVSARLLAGPTEDLNVMVSRRDVTAVADLHELAAGAAWGAELPQGQHLLLVLAGALSLAGGTVGAGDAVRLDGAGRIEGAAAEPCTLLRASFVPRQVAAAGH